MTEIKHPEINVEVLTDNLRKAIDRGRNVSQPLPEISPATEDSSFAHQPPMARLEYPRLNLQPDVQIKDEDHYHVNDLLYFHDEQFIRHAYLAILKREPDATGSSHYLDSLRRGFSNKMDVLASLRDSAEGRAANVRLEGLSPSARIRRLGQLPIIGYPVRLAIAMARLLNMVRFQQQFEATAMMQKQQIADHVNLLSDIIQQRLRALSEKDEQLELTDEVQEYTLIGHKKFQGELEARLGEQNNNFNELKARFEEQHNHLKELDVSLKELHTGLGELNARLAELDQRVGADSQQHDIHYQEQRQLLSEQQAEAGRIKQNLQRTRAELAQQARRLTLIREGQPAMSAQDFDQTDLQTVREGDENQHLLDALYAALEDRFRGSRDEIKERFRVYLPHVKASLKTTDEAELVVDIGCGRGEWLELLKEAGIKAKGVDLNHVLLDECRAHGLEVVESDALAYLRSLPDNSLTALTGFHIIEHLPFESLVQLLDEALRVLRPGAPVIFETPNPENTLVGSNYFYFDPTHRNPLPSLLMQFLLDVRGLHPVEVLHLHPWETARVKGNDELTTRFNDFFYGPMDYAVIGWKVKG